MESVLRPGTTKLLLFTGLLGVLLQPGTTCAVKPTPEIDYKQAQPLIQAAGQIYLHQQLTFKLLADCGSKYKHLAESALHAKQVWRKTNHPVVKKSQHIQELVAKSIQKQRTDYDAVKFTLEIEALVNKSVSEFRANLASKGRKQRHYLCNRLILSVTAGEWDLQRKVPKDVTIISQFKE
ncbi:MAG: hypothetical protein PVG20_07325 [Thioalkalispiraceae bacterium]|jgi:hypothetical protein